MMMLKNTCKFDLITLLYNCINLGDKTLSVNFGPTIVIVFIVLILILFCTFFTARLAQIKGRSKAWGFLGFALNLIGLAIVCFLPSKRNDNINTNPISYAFSNLPSLSKKTIRIIIAFTIAIILTFIAYDNIPKVIENYKYSKEITRRRSSEYEQTLLLTGQAKSIFAGCESSFVITQNDELFCWGNQMTKQLENEQRGLIYKGVKKASTTENNLYILTTDGNLYGKSNNVDNEEEFTLICDSVIDFAVSETSIGIIKSDNKLYMLGNNSYSQLGTSMTEATTKPTWVLNNAKKVICEATYTVVLNLSGEVFAFGTNSYGQFGIKEKIITSPKLISKDILDIAVGDDFILLLNKSNEVLACGNNTYGQLGNLTNESLLEFTKVFDDASSIYASKRSAFILKSNGELYAFGQNTSGQLGIGGTQNINIPTLVEKNVISVATSGNHTVILKNEDCVLSSGNNNWGQLGKGSSRTKFSELVNFKTKE